MLTFFTWGIIMIKTLDKDYLYREIDDFCCRYWHETFGHTIFTFDNPREDLAHFLDEEELPKFTTYVNKTFGTNLSTNENANIPLDFLYKQILEKTVESFDGERDIFHDEAERKRKKWDGTNYNDYF